MYLRSVLISLSLLIFAPFEAYTDSASQTDWSGGPGVLGPVLNLGNEFYFDTDVNWNSNPGDIVLQLIAENTVDGDFDDARSVYSEDIDGDGDMDVLGAAYYDDDITWWENIDGSGISWMEHTVDEWFDGARSVYSEDIDGDGDMDVLGAAVKDDDITWWENIDGSGINWWKHTIDGAFSGAHCVYSEDIDGDGDMDVLGASVSPLVDNIIWWENIDGSGTSWTDHTIDATFSNSRSVYSEDIDGDGDMDIIGANYYSYITWWENEDGSGTSWNEHTIDEDFNGAHCVYSEDIDGDGDMDVLGAAVYADEITWWENINGSGTSWVEHTVDGDFDGARSVYSEDIDGDGDMDILGAAENAGDITWWENEDGSGTSWNEHTIDGDFNGTYSVYSEDINGDGDMDVLGAGDYYNITWWDLTGFSHEGSFESSILDTQGDPCWDYLDWNSQTPPGTSISFQVRASDDHTVMGAWSDTLTSPCQLASILNDGDRYVQYRTILETSIPDSTPTLNDVTITWDPLGIGETVESIPTGTELFPIAPNPSAGSPIIRFGLLVPASVEIFIFDLSGRLVSEIQQDEYSAGYHSELIDDLFQGIYFCRMTTGDFTATQRFVVIE